MSKTVEVRSGLHEDKCANNTWYGWKTPGSEGVASVSALFLGSGSASLEFENCHDFGSIVVFLNHKQSRTQSKIAIAVANGKKTQVKFNFKQGSVLNITAVGGIVKLYSLSISCSGK